ncbi:MAG: glycosyltransferase family 4 protein [Kiloniellaceae bacterium]
MYLLYAVCAALTLLVCIFAERIGTLLGLVDEPDGRRKVHARGTPLVGGLAIIAPLALTAVVLAFDGGRWRLYGTLTLALVAYFFCGFADDYRRQSPWLRLVVCTAAALGAISVVPLFGVAFLWFSFYEPVIYLGGGAAVFSLVCIVGLANAVNMADGQNGVVIGLSLIWTLLLFAYAPSELHPLLFVLALGLAITLVFNLKGLVFLGDSGTYGISLALATLTIYSYNFSVPAFRADAVMLLFLIPVVDCLRLIAVRLPRYGTPFVGDRNHLHHILQRLLPEGAALVAYWTMVGVPSLLVLVFPQSTPWWVALSLAAYALALVKDAVDRRQGIVRAHARSAGWEDRFSIGGSDD